MKHLILALAIGGVWGLQNAHAKTEQMNNKLDEVVVKKAKSESNEDFFKRVVPSMIRKRGRTCEELTNYITANSNKMFVLCKGGYVYRVSIRADRVYVTSE